MLLPLFSCFPTKGNYYLKFCAYNSLVFPFNFSYLYIFSYTEVESISLDILFFHPYFPSMIGSHSSRQDKLIYLVDFFLKYSWFMMLVSGVQQSDSVIHIHTHIYIFIFRFFFLKNFYKILSIVPCTIQLVIYFIHSRVWRIPWTEKPGGLQPMGLQRVGHRWVTNSLPTLVIAWQ